MKVSGDGASTGHHRHVYCSALLPVSALFRGFVDAVLCLLGANPI